MMTPEPDRAEWRETDLWPAPRARHREAAACPRLAAHVRQLEQQYRHLDAEALDRVRTDHETLRCPECSGFRTPPGTPREA